MHKIAPPPKDIPDWKLIPIEQDKVTRWAQQNPPVKLERRHGWWADDLSGKEKAQ